MLILLTVLTITLLLSLKYMPKIIVDIGILPKRRLNFCYWELFVLIFFSKRFTNKIQKKGESGKSTFFKHVNLLRSNYQHDHVESSNFGYYDHVLEIFKYLLDASTCLQQEPETSLPLQNPTAMQELGTFLNSFQMYNMVINGDIIPNLQQIDLVWKNEELLHRAYQMRFHLPLTSFSMDNLYDLMQCFDATHYPIKIEDVKTYLKIYVKSIGNFKTNIRYKNYAVTVEDTGGQKSERKKWKHAIPNTTAVVFMVNLTEYSILEYNGTDRVHCVKLLDSLHTFSKVANHPIFKDTPIFLVFTHYDTFSRMIHYRDLSVAFKDDLPEHLKLDKTLELKIRKKLIKEAKNRFEAIKKQQIPTNASSNLLLRKLSTSNSFVLIKKPTETHNITDLPLEVLEYIMSFLTPKLITKLQLLSYEWYNIVNSDDLWNDICFAQVHSDLSMKINELQIDPIYEKYIQEENANQETLPRKFISCKWKYCYLIGGAFVKNSLDFLLNKFYSAIENEEKRQFVKENTVICNMLEDKQFVRLFSKVNDTLISLHSQKPVGIFLEPQVVEQMLQNEKFY